MFRIVSPLIAFSDQWTMWTHLLRHWFRWDLVGISLGSFDFCPSVSMPGAELWWSTGWHCWERSCTFLCSENMSMFLFRFCSDRLNMFKQTFRWLYDWCDDLIHSLIHLSSIFPEILPARPRKACRSRAVWWTVGTCWNIPADQIIHLTYLDLPCLFILFGRIMRHSVKVHLSTITTLTSWQLWRTQGIHARW
jgi:hypothetical protein